MFDVHDLMRLRNRAVLDNSQREDFYNDVKKQYEATLELCKEKVERIDNLKNVVELKGLSRYVKFEGGVTETEVGFLASRLDKTYFTDFGGNIDGLVAFMNGDKLKTPIEHRGKTYIKETMNYIINDLENFDNLIDKQLKERERKVNLLADKIEISKNQKVVKVNGWYYNTIFNKPDYYNLSTLINNLCLVVNRNDNVYNVDVNGIFYLTDTQAKVYSEDIEITALKNGKAVITFK